MTRQSRAATASYVRNFIFGVEDSLVSTVGLLAGVASADLPRATIVLTGGVLILVEAISMAAGSFLSEQSAKEYVRRAEAPVGRAVVDGTIMFFAYALAGLIPLAPYLLLPVSAAFGWSIALSLIALFALGAAAARNFGIRVFRQGLRMFIVGGLAIAVGVLVAQLLSKA